MADSGALLADGALGFPLDREDVGHVSHRYVGQGPPRDALRADLAGSGIGRRSAIQ